MNIIDFSEVDAREEALDDGEWFALEGDPWSKYRIKVKRDKRWDHAFKSGCRGHKGPLSKKQLNQWLGRGELFHIPDEYLVHGYRKAIQATGVLLALAPINGSDISEEPPANQLASPAELKKAVSYDYFCAEVARCLKELVDPEHEVDEEAEGNSAASSSLPSAGATLTTLSE